MNRRSFFKRVAAFAAGGYAAFVPSKKTDAEVFAEDADVKCDGVIDVKGQAISSNIYAFGPDGLFEYSYEKKVWKQLSIDMADDINKMCLKELVSRG